MPKLASGNILTPEFRVSYPNVFKLPKANKMPDGTEIEPRYGLVMLFPEGCDISELEEEAQRAAREKWGDKIPRNLRSPFRDQGDREADGYVPGAIFITATSKTKPGVVNHLNEYIEDESLFYAGCYAVATVRAFAYDTPMNKGVGFGLQNIQKTRDGEPFGGKRALPEEEFKPIKGGGGAKRGGIFD